MLTANCSTGAGVPSNAGNRTDWPLTGGSLKLDLHHPWTYGTLVSMQVSSLSAHALLTCAVIPC